MMFSSSNHINAFQTCSSSSSSTSHHLPFPLPFFYQETPEILLEQNYADPATFSAPFTSPYPQFLGQHVTNFPASNGSEMAKQETISCQTGSSCYEVFPFLTKKVIKKDRHSKIYTAQGLRDRRVRLSIEISRKFFDLQDMLGFDKASKTLEWLLTKSRKAINELAGTKQKSLPSGSEVSEMEINDNGETLERAWSSINKFNFSEKKCHLAAKESRAKARERARARTVEKTRKSLEFLYQLKPLKEAIAEAEEPGPEEFTANNRFYHPNLPQNWDINTAIARSSLSTVTNMNLSTGSFQKLNTQQSPLHPSNIFCSKFLISRDSSSWKAMGSIQQSTSTLILLDLPTQD